MGDPLAQNAAPAHTSTMTTLLIAILAFGLAAFLWTSARAASETASLLGRRACESAGVQWLDQSVHLVRLRLRRDHRSGRLGIERHYRFDYSRDGNDRHTGRLVLLNTRLVEFAGPMDHASPTAGGTPI